MARQLVDLPRMTAEDLDGEDILLIRDVSARKDKKIKVEDFGGGGGADLDTIFPVGSIRILADSADHSSDFGFTWERYGVGKTLVGLDTSDTDFDTIGETGGEKTHKLVESEMPKHNHSWSGVNTGASQTGQAANYPFRIQQDIANNWSGTRSSMGTTGGDSPHNNLQPYIVVSFWRRTA